MASNRRAGAMKYISIPLVGMTRLVSRDGKTVQFRNSVGGMLGSTYRYELPTVAKAEELEAYAKTTGPDGLPAAIGAKWRKFAV